MLAAVCIVDAFFPPVPSETMVVGLATLAVSTGTPWPWLVVLAASAGAIIGDNLAYAIGRSIGTTRFAWMRRTRVAAAFVWARRGMHKRPASLILTGRYIPVGRIAVNMTAGATGPPARRPPSGVAERYLFGRVIPPRQYLSPEMVSLARKK